MYFRLCNFFIRTNCSERVEEREKLNAVRFWNRVFLYGNGEIYIFFQDRRAIISIIIVVSAGGGTRVRNNTNNLNYLIFFTLFGLRFSKKVFGNIRIVACLR